MANATELWAPARSRPAQDHLGGERRMPANLDCQMAPVGVKDMERVVDVRHRLFAFDVVRGFTSHTGAWARPTKTRNKPWVTVVLARYSSARHRNSVGLGVAAHTPAEAPGPAASGKCSPASCRSRSAPATTSGTHRDYAPSGNSRSERCDRRNRNCRSAGPGRECSADPSSRQRTATPPAGSNCPAGATFSQRSL
jgi:hypothetical protein